jgi:hypothetical protein
MLEYMSTLVQVLTRVLYESYSDVLGQQVGQVP